MKNSYELERTEIIKANSEKVGTTIESKVNDKRRYVIVLSLVTGDFFGSRFNKSINSNGVNVYDGDKKFKVYYFSLLKDMEKACELLHEKGFDGSMYR